MVRGGKRACGDDGCGSSSCGDAGTSDEQPVVKKRRDNHRSRFVFAFYGIFNPELWSERLDLLNVTITEDSRGPKYAFVKTKEKRASEIESLLIRNDAEAPDGMKVRLTTIAGYDTIISFGRGEDPTKHAVYKTMMKYSKSATSVKWESKSNPFSSRQQQQSLLYGCIQSGMQYSGISYENSMQIETDQISGRLVCDDDGASALDKQQSAQKKQTNNRRRFVFAFYGVFNPDEWKETLDLRSATIAQDNMGLKYASIKTKEHRSSVIENHFRRHDKDVPDAMKVKLTTIDGFDSIISFRKGEDPRKHAIYKTIMKFKNSPSYNEWTDESDSLEYDVVKKRKAMESASENNSDDTCPEALKQFEEFEANVLTALLEIDLNDKETRNHEMLQMEQDLYTGTTPTTGGVYVALSKAVKYPKIGATRRAHPSFRLQELSRYVPSPFEAVFWVPTAMPFRTEADIHRHFSSFRIKEKGACTEFFNVDIETVGAYLKANYDVKEDMI